MDDTQRAQVLSGVGYVTGVAGALAPRLLARTFGIRESSGTLDATVRMMSLRNVALAAATSVVADDEQRRKRFFTIAAAMFAADTVTSVFSGVKGKVPARTAVMLGATTAVLAVVAATGAAG